MSIITKIKRLSADYRKHEKELAEIELKKTVEWAKATMNLVTNMTQLAIVSSMPKHPPTLSGEEIKAELKQCDKNLSDIIKVKIGDKKVN